MTAFRFVITSDGPQLGANYSLFPRIMAELIHSHSLAELSFMLTQGRWHGSSWGLPPQPNGPTGASVHAWIYGNESEVDDRWRTLINSLNGLFCTAMTSIVPELTSSPRFAFRRPDSDEEHEMHIRYSAVGKESVCTENLTPWRKLLPCKQHGLVTLLNPLKLYESVYHSMGVELRQSGQGDSIKYQLQLIIYNVLDIPVKSGKLGLLVVFLTCFQSDGSAEQQP
nr:Gpi16 subunit domain containing protein [Haemonchus contortus]